MPRVLRLLLLAAAFGGLIGVGIAVADRPAAPAPMSVSSLPSPTAMVAHDPLDSTAEQTVEGGWTVIRYALAAGDALIIRLRDAAPTSCDLKIHAGPRRDVERVRLGIDVDYAIVQTTQADAEAAEMAQACAGYWITTD